MIIYAGPCLLNADEKEIDNAIKTAYALADLGNNIKYRCKLWGGGTMPERYYKGIGDEGLKILNLLAEFINVGTEIQSKDQLESAGPIVDYLWVGARNSSNYILLNDIGKYLAFSHRDIKEVLIKRSPGMTVDEIIGIHDICEKIHGFKPVIVERGINSFCRNQYKRWTTDYDGMIRILLERKDIDLCLDVSHAAGFKQYIPEMVKAAKAIGIRRYMFEVYHNPEMTKTDKMQAMSIDEFKPIYYFLTGGI